MKLRALCLVLFVGLCARSVAAAPILSIDPSTSTVNQGDTFFFDINITNVIDLYGFQFDILYDSTVLTANEITEGTFLAVGGPTFFFPGTNTPGNLSFTEGFLAGAVPGVSGDGTLARVSFTAASGGSSSISLADINLLLLDSNLNPIDAGTLDARVDVNASSTAPVPEPGTLMLVGSGVAMAWRNRRKLTRA